VQFFCSPLIGFTGGYDENDDDDAVNTAAAAAADGSSTVYRPRLHGCIR